MIAAALAGNAPVIVTGDRELLKGEQLTERLAERGIGRLPGTCGRDAQHGTGRRRRGAALVDLQAGDSFGDSRVVHDRCSLATAAHPPAIAMSL